VAAVAVVGRKERTAPIGPEIASTTFMVRIGVTPAAFTALCDTLPVGSVAFEAESLT